MGDPREHRGPPRPSVTTLQLCPCHRTWSLCSSWLWGHEGVPRDSTTIPTPGAACLGMNLCIKTQLHAGDKLACVCLSPALSPRWGIPNSCSEWGYPAPSGSICLFGREGLVEALGLHFLHAGANPPLQS